MKLLVDTGANVYGCKMSVDRMKLTQDDLIDGATVLGSNGVYGLDRRRSNNICIDSTVLQKTASKEPFRGCY